MQNNICFTPRGFCSNNPQTKLINNWVYFIFRQFVRNRLGYAFVLLLFLLGITTANAQEIGDIDGLIFDPGPTDSTTTSLAQKAVPETKALIKYLKEQEQKEKKFNGITQFGFAGDKTGATSLYKINGGIAVSRGYYPDKFEFATDMGLVINNGVFSENVSNVFITFDHSLPTGDSLFLENYMVMTRFSDEFLGIDQRYELGGGFIVALWSKKLTATGKSEMKRLLKTNLARPQPDSDSVRICIDGQCANFRQTNPNSDDAELLYRAHQQAKVALRKKYNKFRLALLSGLIIEAEKITATDTLYTILGKQQFTQSYDATLKLRWEMRPTIDVKPTDKWSFKIRPFIKMPMPWEWYSTVNSHGFTSKAIDYRLDLLANLTIKLADWSNKQASLDVQYRILYDNAPQRNFLDPLLSTDGLPLLLAAQKTHQIVRLMFQVKF